MFSAFRRKLVAILSLAIAFITPHAQGVDDPGVELNQLRQFAEEQPKTFDNKIYFEWEDGEIVRSSRFTETSGLFGDFDGDGDIDVYDYVAIQICMSFSGPEIPTPPACDVFDSDGDEDIDMIDLAAFMEALTGSIGGVVVEAGGLVPIDLPVGHYYSGEPGTSGNNALNGIAAQSGYTQDDLWYEWSVRSFPETSGDVIFSNLSSPATAFTILSPVRLGSYVFELKVTNLITLESAADSLTLIVNEKAPFGLAVRISDCPVNAVSAYSTFDLGTVVTNASADANLTYAWSTIGGALILGDTDGESVTIEAGVTLGSVSVNVTDDMGTPADDTDDEVDGDTCNFIVALPTISVNAGADVAVNATFTAGATVTISNAAIGVTAIGDDTEFDDTEIIFTWEVLSAPEGVDTRTDVVITNTSNPTLAFRLLSIADANLAILQPTGLATPQSHSAIPGAYNFRVTATNPAGASATDNLTIGVFPAFDADATGGSLTCLAATNGALTDYTTSDRPFHLAFATLLPVDATIQFNLEDQSSVPDPDMPLNSVTVTGSRAVQHILCEVPGVTVPGTYDIEAGFQEATGLGQHSP